MYDAPKSVVSVGAGTAARLLLVATLTAAVCGATEMPGRTIYVRAAGNDANDGSSPARALQHIGRAAVVANPGDRIVVGPGTYREGAITPDAFARVSFIADREGTEVGEPPGDVVIDATTFASAFELNHNLAVTIDGFVVRGGRIGIYVKSQSDQAVVSNNVVTGCGGNGIYIQDSKEATVFNNLVYANGGSGILVTGNVTGSPAARVVNNTVYRNANRGIFFSGTTVGSPNGLVINNAVQGSGVVGIQVNAISRKSYVSAGNVTADGFAKSTPVDVTDVRADPLFVNSVGPDGILGGLGYVDDDFHLSLKATGQPGDSPAVNAGSDSARHLNLSRASTRTDGRLDRGVVDAGYHYGNDSPLPTRPERRLRYMPLYVSSMKGSDSNDGARVVTAVQTLARAFQIAQPGNRVVLLGGTYTEGDLRPSKSGKPGRDIVIQGVDGAQIDATGFARGLLISGRSDITLIGLDISGAGESGIEIRSDSSAITVRSCHLHENGRRGLYVNNASAVTVQSTTVEANGSRGVQVDAGQLDIVRSTINANGEHGVWAMNDSAVSITDAEILDNAKTGVLADQSDVTVADSSIRRSKSGGARFIRGSVGILTRVVVSDNEDGGVQGISSTVSLSDGAVERNARVGIEGLIADNQTNELAVTGTRVCRNQGPGVRAQESGVVLSDATVCENSQEGLRQTGGTVQITGTSVTQNEAKGISVSGADRVTLAGLTVGDNEDNGVQIVSTTNASIMSSVVSSNSGNGVSASDVPALAVATSQVSDNAKSGVAADQSGLTIEASTLRDNGQEGVRHSGGTAQIMAVMAVGNRGKGLSVFGASQLTVQNALVGSNGDNGIEVSRTPSPSISGSSVYSNAGEGVAILDSLSATIWNNLIYANQGSGILVGGETAGSPTAQILNNTIFGNSNRGVLIGGSDLQPPSHAAVVLRNIVRGNASAGLQVNQLSLPGYMADYNLNTDPYGALTPVGMHDVLADPLLVQPAGVDGVLGAGGAGDDDFHLSQRAAGQGATSPAVDAGGVDVGTTALQGTTTRTDRVADTGAVDIGYHYRP